MSGFLKSLTKNRKIVDKIIDKGADFLGKKAGFEGATSHEQANEDWTHTATGNKKALFIGINYFGQKGELRGCINDVENIKAFVESKCGFSSQNMMVLIDSSDSRDSQPTRDNIVSAMKWLVGSASPGDTLFLHYSGHGSQQQDADGDEGDGRDETICPVDYSSSGMITDDEMHRIMLSGLPEGVKFVSIFDCCHSGSILDLPYTYSIDGDLEIHEKDNRIAAAKTLMKAGLDYAGGNKQRAINGLMASVKEMFKGKKQGGAVSKDKMDEKTTRADVVQFSGCMDSQTSADATIGGEATGAMSHAFIEALEKMDFDLSYKDLLRETRAVLTGKYSQVPQMSAGKKLRMDVRFVL